MIDEMKEKLKRGMIEEIIKEMIDVMIDVMIEEMIEEMIEIRIKTIDVLVVLETHIEKGLNHHLKIASQEWKRKQHTNVN